MFEKLSPISILFQRSCIHYTIYHHFDTPAQSTLHTTVPFLPQTIRSI